jgi:hypothetical protein
MLERQREHTARVLELYRGGKAPGCFIAKLLGKSNAEFFRVLMADPKLSVWSFDGSQEGIRRENLLVGTRGPILLEVSALVTLHSLQLLEAVKASFPRVLITQQTADSLNEILVNLFPERRVGRICSDSPGHICMVEETSAEVVGVKLFYESLLEFVRSTCEVVASPANEEFEDPTIRQTLAARV